MFHIGAGIAEIAAKIKSFPRCQHSIVQRSSIRKQVDGAVEMEHSVLIYVMILTQKTGQGPLQFDTAIGVKYVLCF